MSTEELQFRNTCVEYLKVTDQRQESIELQTIISRSDVRFIKTRTYRGGDIWNQRNMDIELRVPIPLLERANGLKILINDVFKKVCPEDDQYGYGCLNIKPKMIGAEDITYKEYDVVFENIKQTIIQGIRDAKYVIWIAVAWFTNRDIFDELCLRKKDGLNIRIITIGNNTNKHLLNELESEFDTLKITLPGGHIFHHKFCIIDFEYVMHGSFNWSKNAEGNEETWSTALDRDFSRKFADKFMRMYKSHIVDQEDIVVDEDVSTDLDDWEANF